MGSIHVSNSLLTRFASNTTHPGLSPTTGQGTPQKRLSQHRKLQDAQHRCAPKPQKANLAHLCRRAADPSSRGRSPPSARRRRRHTCCACMRVLSLPPMSRALRPRQVTSVAGEKWLCTKRRALCHIVASELTDPRRALFPTGTAATSTRLRADTCSSRRKWCTQGRSTRFGSARQARAPTCRSSPRRRSGSRCARSR